MSDLAPVIPPAGLHPAGFYLPQALETRRATSALLADWIDPTTGELVTLRRAPHPVDAAIAWQFTAVRRTGAAVMEQGQRFKDTRKAEVGAELRLRYEVEQLVAPFVSAGDIRVRKIEVHVGVEARDTAAIYFAYTNLHTGKDEDLRA